VLKRPDSAAEIPVGLYLYPKTYLVSQFNSEVGPGGYPCQGLNEPLIWYLPSVVLPPDSPWVGKKSIAGENNRIYIADCSRSEKANPNPNPNPRPRRPSKTGFFNSNLI
jgi:hypothetical protein